MRIPLLVFGIVQLLGECTYSLAWDNDELEVFDVVEEVNQNFYDLMGVSQAANASEIKKAFRRLSLQLHPDKNPAENAEEQFRKLVAVYDVLRDAGKRQRYDNVLINGLPNWRSAVYYYRHVRKMGLLELSIILFTVITVGQYLVAWAAYFEKRYTYEQVLGSKLQKMQKKNRKGKMDVPDLADILERIPTPSIWNTLPFQLPRWVITSVTSVPSTIRTINIILEERKNRKKQEEEESAQENEQPEVEPVPRGPRRRRTAFTPQERSSNCVKETVKQSSDQDRTNQVANDKPVIQGGLWTDDDILELIKLVKKYPGGTPERWEKIAESMNRTVTEVTHMAKKVKDEGLKPTECYEDGIPEERPKKVKTRADNIDTVAEWSRDQQRALEAALVKYPKGSSVDRWEKIAASVEGKTKTECQARYRQLVEIVKKKQQPQ